jgi:hypothetical protein
MLINMALATALSALDSYIAQLADSARRTRQAENRSRYRDHLAEAAVFFHLLYNDDLAGTKELVGQEQRSYGTGSLVGPEGAAAESAFAAFEGIIKDM